MFLGLLALAKLCKPQECRAGTYFDGEACKACSRPCATCAGSPANCTSCAADACPVHGKCVVAADCETLRLVGNTVVRVVLSQPHELRPRVPATTKLLAVFCATLVSAGLLCLASRACQKKAARERRERFLRANSHIREGRLLAWEQRSTYLKKLEEIRGHMARTQPNRRNLQPAGTAEKPQTAAPQEPGLFPILSHGRSQGRTADGRRAPERLSVQPNS